MHKKIIFEARVNEYAPRTSNPNIPYTADEIAEAAVAARSAGAAILHYHARTADGGATNTVEANAEIIRKVRAATDLLILPTLGFISNDTSAKNRIDTVVALASDPATKPDIAPIDTGSANLEIWDPESGEFGNPERLYINTTESLIHYARRLAETGVKPKLVTWSVGFTRRAMALMDAGLVKGPAYFLLHLTGGRYITGHPPTEAGLMAHLAFLPDDRPIEWTVNCLGGNLLGIASTICRLGGHMAIGIGDYPYRELGTPRNADVISRAVDIAQKVGRDPATPAEAREILQLDGK
ncbi:3-keto-5-aminohexanoate cleavage protein [Mesorhizobium sp.]|uniref:3-keto-5-aminohexanoate cleavage protein n=1 Tax=Mesorhizobium sp. TaxID=1871066 RepID=UPI000FE96E24|nr:3-keto-5-aminohexanoate cleavage protein [Mesorhizobium sp.]RWH44711.1 MAG: 3-keto-5-aminohexanoate cleavage protein [Mesorhizobium sp.]